MSPTGTARVPVHGTLTARLRDETAAAHQALEQEVDLDRRLRSVESYADLLAALHPFHRALEAEWSRRSGWAELQPPVDLFARRRAALLAEDLQALDRPVPPRSVRPPLPELPGLPGALGSLYVSEGSTLGGAYVARRATAQLGLTADRGLAFFTGAGPLRGERWKALRRTLTCFGDAAPPADVDRLVRAAHDTFAALTAWLRRAA